MNQPSATAESKARRILVTGARGYLGTQLCERLRAVGHRVTATARAADADESLPLDLADRDAVRRAVDLVRPELIVHAAAVVPTTLEAYGDDAAAAASVRLLENVLAASMAPLLLISSMTVYGDRDDGPAKESDECHPTSAYARGKLQAEGLARESGVAGWAIRIPGLYGASRRSGLVYNAVEAVRAGRMPTLPQQPITWAAMDVGDAAAGIADLVDAVPQRLQPINLGYAGRISIDAFVDTLAQASGMPIPYDVKHPGFEFDLSRFEAVAGRKPPRFDAVVRRMLA